jgi:hypothetical protein
MHPGLDRVHRAQPHRLEGPVVQLAAVVLAHTALSVGGTAAGPDLLASELCLGYLLSQPLA